MKHTITLDGTDYPIEVPRYHHLRDGLRVFIWMTLDRPSKAGPVPYDVILYVSESQSGEIRGVINNLRKTGGTGEYKRPAYHNEKVFDAGREAWLLRHREAIRAWYAANAERARDLDQRENKEKELRQSKERIDLYTRRLIEEQETANQLETWFADHPVSASAEV